LRGDAVRRIEELTKVPSRSRHARERRVRRSDDGRRRAAHEGRLRNAPVLGPRYRSSSRRMTQRFRS
jgi:hypothetical protein